MSSSNCAQWTSTYRGNQKEFVAVVNLNGGKDTQTVSLEPKDFNTLDGEAMSSWKNVDLLSFRAFFEKGEKLVGSKNWDGSQRVFRKLWWQAN